MLMNVQKEPVGINKNGKPVAVVLSANEEQFREDWLKAQIQKGMKSVKNILGLPLPQFMRTFF